MSALFWIACLLIFLALVLCFIRMLMGPDLPNRVIALDLLTNILMASIILFSLYQHEAIYIDVVIVVALIMFLSITMYAYYLQKQVDIEEASDAE